MRRAQGLARLSVSELPAFEAWLRQCYWTEATPKANEALRMVHPNYSRAIVAQREKGGRHVSLAGQGKTSVAIWRFATGSR